ncbi:hypothetical protein SAMN04487911_10439 [Arenibacter nanhaiticus]|uniref:Uncharacterized protein n=1 Tax=Arenibacter nanhaiticus TaxID=558155 RepID=A0A1M6CSV7_9FLAO|nr:hypothetical protein SAMN04487911_10439 [Arenibacter nanhaiticus]
MALKAIAEGGFFLMLNMQNTILSCLGRSDIKKTDIDLTDQCPFS